MDDGQRQALLERFVDSVLGSDDEWDNLDYLDTTGRYRRDLMAIARVMHVATAWQDWTYMDVQSKFDEQGRPLEVELTGYTDQLLVLGAGAFATQNQAGELSPPVILPRYALSALVVTEARVSARELATEATVLQVDATYGRRTVSLGRLRDDPSGLAAFYPRLLEDLSAR